MKKLVQGIKADSLIYIAQKAFPDKFNSRDVMKCSSRSPALAKCYKSEKVRSK